MKEQMICANCGKEIPQGEGRWITLERNYTLRANLASLLERML